MNPMRQQKLKGKKNRDALLDKIREFTVIEADKFVADVLWMAIQIKRVEKELLRDHINDLNTGQTQTIGRLSEDAFIDRSERGLTPEQSAEKMIRPLASTLKSLAEPMFWHVFGDVMQDPNARVLFLQEMAVNLGKKGGRPAGRRMKHIIWLEGMIDSNERINGDGLVKLTAEQHFAELRLNQSIDGEDSDGNLRFLASFLEEDFGWYEGKTEEPKITLNAVREALTRIRASK